MPLSNLYSKQQSTNTVVIMSLLGNFRLNERQVIQACPTKILSSFLRAELDPVKTDVSFPEPTKDETERAKARRPARSVKSKKGKSSDMLHNTGDESDHKQVLQSSGG